MECQLTGNATAQFCQQTKRQHQQHQHGGDEHRRGRKPMGVVRMFKTLEVRALYNLSDALQ